jgi:hypothetical protein
MEITKPDKELGCKKVGQSWGRGRIHIVIVCYISAQVCYYVTEKINREI